ncbi:MAG: signal peptidase I [Opitutales bacterium]|nr:signal peptidase I [Opitutales bacterium]
MKKLVLILFVALIAGGFALWMRSGQTVVLTTDSMHPTLREGQKVKLKAVRNEDELFRRFQIVGYTYGDQPDHVFVARIGGLPNEAISIRDSGLYVNGSRVNPPVRVDYSQSIPMLHREEIQELKLGPDEYFLLGDNSATALDGRYLGPTKRSNIVGIIRVRELKPRDPLL